MTSFSHREFTDSLITQKLTLCQVMDCLYNMDIYGTQTWIPWDDDVIDFCDVINPG